MRVPLCVRPQALQFLPSRVPVLMVADQIAQLTRYDEDRRKKGINND